MPEGDSLFRAAQRLQVLVGQHISVEAPHPMAAAKQIAPRLDGKRLESVEAAGKNLLLHFEGGLTLRSHLKMKGRWWVYPRGRELGDGKPWLVLRGAKHEAVLWHGPVLELDGTVRRRLGPDILAEPPDLDAMLANLRALLQETLLGEALQTQRAVAGIGNMWTAEALWHAQLSPWLTLRETPDEELRAVLEAAAGLMRESTRGIRAAKHVHRRAGRACSRCGSTIRSRRQVKRRGRRRAVTNAVALRAPHLYRSLRGFCLGAFRVLCAELDSGTDLPFAFEEHASFGRPALYEYRPLVRSFLESRASALAKRDDARIAIEDLAREPAARIFSRAHAGARANEDDALFRTVVLPLLMSTAEACGGFDWDDASFDRAYAEVESSLFGEGHAYAAVAPLVGLSAGTQIELGGGMRVRAAATGELAAHWPEAQGLLPQQFGSEPDRLCVLELERDLVRGDAEPPDAPGELADAVTAIRLATAGPVAAGPILFERLDWRPYGIRPVLPIAATQPAGEPTRLDAFRGSLAGELRARLPAADEDRELGEALDRWELSLFQDEPFRAEQLRESLTALLGGPDGLWAACIRAAVLLGESPKERGELLAQLRRDRPAPNTVRRALVEVLMHGDRVRLVESLDEAILGLRPRPPGYFALRAAS